MTLPVAALSTATQEIIFSAGVALTLLGMAIRWRWPDYRMVTEERKKEGRLTEAQVRRRLAMMRFGGPLIVLVAVALFSILFWN